jgi:adenylate cyclase
VSSTEAPRRDDEEFWRDFLSGGHSKERAGRRVFKLIPTDPRCRLCAAPFGGIGGSMMRAIGKRPSAANPNWCNSCFDFMQRHRGGAEIECTMLFADVRGSTTLAEGMSAADFRRLMDRFYEAAATVVFDHDGIVDKFVGDELVSMFFPLLSGDRHAARAVEAARALLHETGHGESDGPWVPVGAGVHTGISWVGAVGSETHVELTALGDAVNTTARLASAAGAGEVLVTADTATAAGLDSTLERRPLELKGKQQVTEVVTLRVGPEPVPFA